MIIVLPCNHRADTRVEVCNTTSCLSYMTASDLDPVLLQIADVSHVRRPLFCRYRSTALPTNAVMYGSGQRPIPRHTV